MMKRARIAVTGIAVLATVGGFLAYRYPAWARDREYAAVGAEWEKTGKLSKADYLRVHSLSDSEKQAKPLSESDLAFSLDVLKSSQSIVRVRALGLLERTALDGAPSQKERIAAAISPSLSSKDTLESLAAKRVKSRLNGVQYKWQ